MRTPAISRYMNHRFPAEIINHGVWSYFRFWLSYRDVGERLFARGIIVTYEAIRKWCHKFRQTYANQAHHRRPWPGDKWYLDEAYRSISGERHYLWRAEDQDGHVLDTLGQRRRASTPRCPVWPRDGPTIPDLAGDYGHGHRRLSAKCDTSLPPLHLMMASARISWRKYSCVEDVR